MEKNLNGLQGATASKAAISVNGSEKGKQDSGFISQRYNGRCNSRRRDGYNCGKAADKRPGPGPRRTQAFADSRPRQARQQRASGVDNWRSQVSDLYRDGDEEGLTGSRKHNLNHLLNFSFAPRESVRSHDYNGNHYRISSKYHKFCKEQFLQANCQFLVKEGNDYSKHRIDPDIPVDWELVEEVRFNSLTTETTVCPICLHPPNAAKITKCGHIYCWSCILHYLALSDSSFRKCPICFDHIFRKDLRSVLSVKMKDFKVSDEIQLRLMKRRRGLVVANPVSGEEPNSNGPDGSSYQKFLVASPAQVLSDVINRESDQLQFQMQEESNTPEVCFIESALESLREREMSMRTAVNSGELKAKSVDFVPEAKSSAVAADGPDKPTEDDDCYYFYQSADGQHIYLHSLNVRMLCKEYGSLANCPVEIKAKIVEMEWNSMNDEKRKRHRYIQHLPMTCEYRIVELDMVPPLVSEETYEAFRGEILRRVKERRKRAREEKKREKNIKVEQEKKIHGIYPMPRYNLDNLNHFPIYCSDQAANPQLSGSSESSAPDETEGNVNHTDSADETSACSHNETPSFASMLKEGKSKVSSVDTKTRCSSKAVVEDGSTESLSSEYTIKPVHQYSLSDALEAALTMKDSKRRKSKKKK